MIAKLAHAINVLRSVAREKHKEATRSSHWPVYRDRYLASHGTCAACGSKKRLQVHHIKPYHLHPELELDPTNFITLCMDTNECHLRVGHGGNFDCFNENAVLDAAALLKHPATRATVEARARQNRKS